MRTQKFGASIRKLADKAIDAKRARYECPKCHKLKVKRDGTAKWNCRSCGAVFAGGAYSFTTEAGEIAARLTGEYSNE
jgi:large subunit ribosomal protein L37Ae